MLLSLVIYPLTNASNVDRFCSGFSAALTITRNKELEEASIFRPISAKPKTRLGTAKSMTNYLGTCKTKRPQTVPANVPTYKSSFNILPRIMAVNEVLLEREASIKMTGSFKERTKTPLPPILPDPFQPQKRVSVDLTRSRRKSRRRSTLKQGILLK